jgi:hypothetical protein
VGGSPSLGWLGIELGVIDFDEIDFRFTIHGIYFIHLVLVPDKPLKLLVLQPLIN